MSKPGVIEKKPMARSSGSLFRRIQLSVTFVILALSIIKGAMLFREAASLQGKMTELRGDIANSKRIYRIDEMEHEWSGYVDKIDQASRLSGMRSVWGDKLGVLAEAIPSGLAFEFVSFTATSNAKSGVMILETMVPPEEKQGYALAKKFVDELKRTKQFGENIKINYVERNERGLEVIQIMVKFS